MAITLSSTGRSTTSGRRRETFVARDVRMAPDEARALRHAMVLSVITCIGGLLVTAAIALVVLSRAAS